MAFDHHSGAIADGFTGSKRTSSGLVRQYSPNSMNLNDVSQVESDDVADLLNARPRKTLGFFAPTGTLEALSR
jgi:IS30 family transposase